MLFKKYHFHIYFPPNKLSSTLEIVEKIKGFDFLKVGPVWNKPIGPHPVGSCQVTVLSKNFYEMTHWFLEHRNNLSIFIHGVSGNDWIDHTKYIMWIGKPYKLKLDFFNNQKGNSTTP